MLYAINVENAHKYGDILPQLYRLRFRQFKERQNYTVPVYKGMEYDQYDTPATVYLTWVDEYKNVRGISRLNPTDRPYMLKDLWPDMVTGQLPNSPYVWEGTRICIEKSLPGYIREKIKWEIVLGYLEFALKNRIEKYIGVMQNFIWHKVFVQSDWGAEFLDDEKIIDGIKTRAGQVMVSEAALQRVRTKTGIFYDVLRNSLEETNLIAA
jgi:N-acyl-L-homoserine lactone synthetase